MALFTTVSRLICYCLTWEKRVFQFLCSRCDIFSKLLTFLALPLSNLSQPKINFLSNPFNSKLVFCDFNLKVCFLKHFSFCLSQIMQKNQLGFSKLGIFRKWVEVLNFCENFSKILIGLSPICHLCICVGPLWQFEHVLRHFSFCSCIPHKSFALLHDRCLSKCPSDILVLNWTQVSSNDLILSCLIMFIMFWSLSLCFTHFAHFAHTRHPPCISCISICTHMHQHMHTYAHTVILTSLMRCVSIYMAYHLYFFCLCARFYICSDMI